MERKKIKLTKTNKFVVDKMFCKNTHINKDKVEIFFKNDQLISTPLKQSRLGWDKAFTEMANNGDRRLLIDDVFEDEIFN